jgi:hypothetical protein
MSYRVALILACAGAAVAELGYFFGFGYASIGIATFAVGAAIRAVRLTQPALYHSTKIEPKTLAPRRIRIERYGDDWTKIFLDGKLWNEGHDRIPNVAHNLLRELGCIVESVTVENQDDQT